MALIKADRVKETSTSAGATTFALAGAATGYRSFASVCSIGDTFYYAISHQTSNEWETGLGTYSGADTLTRTTVHSSSNSGSAVNFSAGTKEVFLALTATQLSTLGTVSSVTGTGAVNGISLSGTVTGTGNIALGGTLSGVDLTAAVSGILPVTNGGTGTATGSITGTSALTFTAGGTNNSIALSASDATLNTTSNGADVSITTGKGYKLVGSKWQTHYGFLKINGDFNIGPGKGGAQWNAVLGKNALNSYDALQSAYTVAIGPSALENCTSTSFDVAIGSGVLNKATTSLQNTGVGGAALSYLESGSRNTAVGVVSLGRITSGINNVAVGWYAGVYQADNTESASFDNCIMIGYETKVNTANDSNSIVIGYQAVGKGTNSTVIGNTSTNAAWIFGNTLNLGNGASAAAITANGALTVAAGGSNESVNIIPTGTGKARIHTLNVSDYSTPGGWPYGAYASIQPVQRTTTGDGGTLNLVGPNALTTGAGGSVQISPGAAAGGGARGIVQIDGVTISNNSKGLGIAIGGTAVAGQGSIGIGYRAGDKNDPSSVTGRNVFIGYEAGYKDSASNDNTSGVDSVCVGYRAYPSGTSDSNSIVIGYNAVGAGSNTAVIGNSSVVFCQLSGYTKTKSVQETVFAITDGGSVDINPANGGIQTWTLGANRTPTASSFAEGQSVTLMIDDGTAYAITWSSVSPTWIGGSAPTLATSGFTVIELWKRSTVIYGALVGTA